MVPMMTWNEVPAEMPEDTLSITQDEHDELSGNLLAMPRHEELIEISKEPLKENNSK